MDKQIQESQEMSETAKPVEDIQDEREADVSMQPENTKAKADAKRKWIKHIPLLIIEACVLIVAIGIMYVVVTATKEVERKNIDKEKITINEEVAEIIREEEENNETKGYRNIALFGVDARDGELGRGTRSDSIIIASINQDTQEIKLVSVFRDTYLNLGNDSYNKCNAAYAQGGPEQAISMLNANLDLDITDYVTVGFGGLIDAVDALGGIEIEVTDAEISHLNNYQLTMSEELGVDYIPVKESGLQLLNGMQATAYCRIRYTKGDDFRRAERQRDVLTAMMEKAKTVSVGSLTSMVNAILPEVETSLGVNEILSVLGSVAGYDVVASDGFPFEDNRVGANVGSKGSCVIPDNLEENVEELHVLLFPEVDYKPSKQVINISDEIVSLTDEYR
ncbi:MAG: LCP family protein [Lachnospiraceae bacterium]|nr:LCP family protein [Lachnospiraceae bacterium]